MKKSFYVLLIATLSLLCVSSAQGQNTGGTEFWLTFGRNDIYVNNANLNLQIRIVGGSKQTEGKIHFTNLGTYINFNLNPYETYDCQLDFEQRQAVYNTVMGKTDYSIHITADNPVNVYAYNHYPAILDDVTNVLPVTALGGEYYHISYTQNFAYRWDAYAVVATKNNTQLYHNGFFVETLNAGQVYYRTSDTDMTGSLITSNNPVAFFAVHQRCNIPPVDVASNLMQQLAPVNTWGKNFFVPVSMLDKEIVRIVAAHNDTDIIQTGGTIRTGIPGAQTHLTGLQAGQFVELDIALSANGCHIEANKPVGVCAYFRGFFTYPLLGSIPAQCWIPCLEQKITQSLIAPFIPSNFSHLSAFYALIVTPTPAKNNTTVSVGGALPTALYGGNWYDNASAGMSFYSFPLTNSASSYMVSNPEGLIIYGYAHGTVQPSTYYFLAGSAMRDLDAAFYANDIHFQDLKENPFCAGVVDFRAEIEGLHQSAGSLKWYVDGEYQPTLDDQPTWSKTFTPDEYEIRMWVRFENNDTISKIGTLKIISCNQSAEFYANDIPSRDLSNYIICNKTGKVDFHAEIEGLSQEQGSLKWYVDDVEQPAAQNQQTWSKTFETGTYQIKMWVRYDSGEEETVTATLKVEIFFIKIQNVRH